MQFSKGTWAICSKWIYKCFPPKKVNDDFSPKYRSSKRFFSRDYSKREIVVDAAAPTGNILTEIKSLFGAQTSAPNETICPEKVDQSSRQSGRPLQPPPPSPSRDKSPDLDYLLLPPTLRLFFLLQTHQLTCNLMGREKEEEDDDLTWRGNTWVVV